MPDANEIAELSHLVHADWDRSVMRQGTQLAGVIGERWGLLAGRILDAACGIGTQALGLAQRGYRVSGGDEDEAALRRAEREAARLDLTLRTAHGGLRAGPAIHGGGFDAAIACDSALARLLDEVEIGEALRALHDCLKPGGGLALSLRDYAVEPRGRGRHHAFGVREHLDERVFVYRVVDFDGERYDETLYFVRDDGVAAPRTVVRRAQYFAIPVDRLLALLRKAGFSAVERIDGAFFEPLVVGTRAD